MADDEFHNDSGRPLFVPGFHDLPVSAVLPKEKRFSHGANDWAQWPNLTARELAMLHLMEALTDKRDWHSKIFNSDIVARWREEALSMPLISVAAWEWCLAELQDKAIDFEKTGLAIVLNAGCAVCKSDCLVSPELQDELKRGAQPLLEVPNEQKDWHPNSDHQVLNLVHPSLYPLVYGRTMVMSEGGQVDLLHPLHSCGKGVLAPLRGQDDLPRTHHKYVQGLGLWNSNLKVPPTFWTQDLDFWHIVSGRFQWLPCEVEFTGPSNQSTDVRITSYINNLHPKCHRELYQTIEKLISLSVEPWNQILVQGGKRRWPLRIHTWGVESRHDFPEWFNIPRMRELEKNRDSEEFRVLCRQIEDYLAIPEAISDGQRLADDYGPDEWTHLTLENWREVEDGCFRIMQRKRSKIYHWTHPDASVAYSYSQWKTGDTANAIIERTSRDYPESGPIEPYPDHEYYNVALQETFRNKGLQVHVKLASVELTPEKPSYKGGNWHVEGLINEHIVATSIYYYDVENVTEARLSFRQETKMDPDEFTYESYDFEPLAAVFGVPGVEDMLDGPYVGGFPAFQDLGSVVTREGRLLAFPNTLQHRVEPFELADKKRPGHRRFIVLWLVDPNYRVCSTRNVPPQQHDWWKEEALNSAEFAERRVPPEIIQMVGDRIEEWPMGLTEAKSLRLELMKERVASDNYQMTRGGPKYHFCEH